MGGVLRRIEARLAARGAQQSVSESSSSAAESAMSACAQCRPINHHSRGGAAPCRAGDDYDNVDDEFMDDDARGKGKGLLADDDDDGV